MNRRFMGILVICLILTGGVSCKRIGQSGPGDLKLAAEQLTRTDSIPSSWGKLVSVSSAPGVETWVQLWFQDDGGTIRVASFNVKDNYIYGKVGVIRRD